MFMLPGTHLWGSFILTQGALLGESAPFPTKTFFYVNLLVMPALVFSLDCSPELRPTGLATLQTSPLRCVSGPPHLAFPKLSSLSPSTVLQNLPLLPRSPSPPCAPLTKPNSSLSSTPHFHRRSSHRQPVPSKFFFLSTSLAFHRAQVRLQPWDHRGAYPVAITAMGSMWPLMSAKPILQPAGWRRAGRRLPSKGGKLRPLRKTKGQETEWTPSSAGDCWE